MFKLCIFACILALAAAAPKPDVLLTSAYAPSYSRSWGGYSAPLSYSAPLAYTAPLTYSAPLTYPAPLTYSAALTYPYAAAPFAAYSSAYSYSLY